MRKNDNEELAKAIETIRTLDKKVSEYKEANKGTLEQLSKEIEKLQITDDKLRQQAEKIKKERAKLQSEIEQRKQKIDNIYELMNKDTRKKEDIQTQYNYPNMELTIKNFDDLPLISNMHGVVFDLKDYKDVMEKASNRFSLQITDQGIKTYPASYSHRYDGKTAFLNITKNEDGSINLMSEWALNIHSSNVKAAFGETDEHFWKNIQEAEAFVEATTGKKLPERQKHRAKTANLDFSKLFNKCFGRS